MLSRFVRSSITNLLIAASISVYSASASTIYSDQGPWRILQVHETFSLDKKHSHCTAYRTLGDRSLFVDVDRRLIEDFKSMTENMMTIRYFDNSFLWKHGNAEGEVTLLIDDGQTIKVTGDKINYEAGSVEEFNTHDPYVLSIVDKDTFTLDIGNDGSGAASITERDHQSINTSLLINGMQASLSIDEGFVLTAPESGFLSIDGTLSFPLEGFGMAVETLIECNRNTLAAEINLADVNPENVTDPFTLLIQRNLPSTPENREIFIENLTNLVKAYAPSVQGGLSEFWPQEKAEAKGFGPDGTLFVWSGDNSFGSIYYNSYVFDDLRKRRLNGHYLDCISAGGEPHKTGVRENIELGLIGKEQILWCGGVSGNPNAHIFNFLYSIYSEYDGDSIGIEDSFYLERDYKAVQERWEDTVGDYPPLQE